MRPAVWTSLIKWFYLLRWNLKYYNKFVLLRLKCNSNGALFFPLKLFADEQIPISNISENHTEFEKVFTFPPIYISQCCINYLIIVELVSFMFIFPADHFSLLKLNFNLGQQGVLSKLLLVIRVLHPGLSSHSPQFVRCPSSFISIYSHSTKYILIGFSRSRCS